jgi:hypothetical protein
MVGFWIDSRYHNPKTIGIVSFQGVAEDQEGLQNGKGGRTEKVGVAHLTVN